MSMESMTVDLVISKPLLVRELSLWNQRRIKLTRANAGARTLQLAQTVCVIIIGAALILTASQLPDNLRALLLPAIIGLVVCGFFLNREMIRRALGAVADDAVAGAGRVTIELCPEGIVIARGNVESGYPWHLLEGVERKADCTVLTIGTQMVLPLAHDGFASDALRAQFFDLLLALRNAAVRVEAHWSESESNSPAAALEAASPRFNDTRAAPLIAEETLRNLRGGWRAALFLNVTEDDFAPSFIQTLIFALLLLAATLAFDSMRAGVRGEFAWYGLSSAVAIVPVLLWAASLICAGANQQHKTLAVFTALFAAALFVHIGSDVVRLLAGQVGSAHLLPWQWAITGWLTPAWLAAVMVSISVRFGCLDSLRGLAAAMAGVCLLSVSTSLGLLGGAHWLPAENEDAEASRVAYNAAAAEDVIYAQPRLIQRAINALTPGRSDVPNLFYVGMAGYAPQDVFMKEVIAAEAVFKQRFGAGGRTIKLINNSKTLMETPVASVSALEAALTGVSKAMDKDNDILFLFLTSHGSRDHKLSLELPPWKFNDFDPKRLRAVVDASGMKWKVIVVSACYSGGFVEALKSPATLVITASAADKTSFGCSNEADFTYFGKAYFDQALRQTLSFTGAFDLARAEISKREALAKYSPSNPQMALGADIKAKLEEFEKGLLQPPASAAPASADAPVR